MAIHNQPITIQSSTYGTTRMTLRYTDLVAAATSQVLTFVELNRTYARGGTVPANAMILGAELLLVNEFAGNGAATATISLGDAAAPTELLLAQNVFAGGVGVGSVTQADGALTLPAFEVAAYAAQITFTADVNLGDATNTLLTAGAAELRIVYRSSSTTSI